MVIDEIVSIILLSVATEATTEVMVASKVTEDIRNRIRILAHPMLNDELIFHLTFRRKVMIFIDDLVSCGYCASMWVAMFWSLFAPYVLNISSWLMVVINWLLMVVVLHRFSNLFHVLLMLIKNGRVKTFDIELKFQNQIKFDGVVDGSIR
jgi:Protein of unknown function (DUF1360)